MPELPTREELAEVIANCTCVCQGDWQVDHQIACPNAFVAADAVLHLLMRDADTEWAQRWEDGTTMHHPDRKSCEAFERQQRARNYTVPEIVSRRSVTFTGEWEPAGAADEETT